MENVSFENSERFKTYKEKYPAEPVGGKYFVDTIDLRHTTNLSTFVEDQAAMAQLRLNSIGFPNLRLVGELIPHNDPNEMIYISHLIQVEKGHTNG